MYINFNQTFVLTSDVNCVENYGDSALICDSENNFYLIYGRTLLE